MSGLENGVVYTGHARPLPEEMLVEIFMHCVAYDQLSERAPSSTSPPLTLAWVCQYWRRLALSMPELWSSISLGGAGTDPINDTRFLDLWTERAGTSKPLHIKICHEMRNGERPVFLDPNRGECYLIGMRLLADRLLSLSHQWRTLELHALDLYVFDSVLRLLLSSGAPRLKSLSISTRYSDHFGSVYFLDLSLCPSLRDLRLFCPMLCPTARSDVAANMTNLELHFCPSMMDCLVWLKICPNLQQLSMRAPQVASSSAPAYGPLMLSRLTHLAISCTSDSPDPNILLDVLILPSLRDLLLDMSNSAQRGLGRAWCENIHANIKRLGSSLKRLVLLGTPMPSEALLRLLRLTPHLKELVLGGSVITDHVLEVLSINMKADEEAENTTTFKFCPRLEILELRDSHCSVNALVSFTYARCRLAGFPVTYSLNNAVVPVVNTGLLKKVILVRSAYPTLLFASAIQACISGGLDIVHES